MVTRIKREQLTPAKDRVHHVWWECSECGGEVHPNDSYCSHCGKKFTKG